MNLYYPILLAIFSICVRADNEPSKFEICVNNPSKYWDYYYEACFNCDVGKRQLGDNKCDDCPVGKGLNSDLSECISNCPVGKRFVTDRVCETYTGRVRKESSYDTDEHFWKKGLCERGYEVYTIDTCKECPMGKYYDSTYHCSECPPGKYQNQKGQDSCKDCSNPQKVPGAGDVMYYCGDSHSKQLSNCNYPKYVNKDGNECVTHIQSLYDICKCNINSEVTFGQACPDNAVPTQYIPCQPGTYWQTSDNKCIKCPAGQYQTETGSTTCKNCNVGRHSPNTGSTDCLDCPPGTYQNNEGQTLCEDCGYGQYNTNTGSDSSNDCLDCQPGQYQNQRGQVDCKNCNSGRYSWSQGSRTCTIALPGFYTDGEGKSEQKPCPANTFSFKERGSKCSDPNCPAGSKNEVYDDNGEIKRTQGCSWCAVGLFQNIAHKTTCKKCTPGNYQAEVGQKICTACPAGFSTGGSDNVREHYGKSACDICLRGTSQAEQGKSYCNDCSSGFYQAKEGGLKCNECYHHDICESNPAGNHICGYSFRKSNTCVDMCPDHSYNRMGQECEWCPLGYYSKNAHCPTTQCPPQHECTECAAGRYEDTVAKYGRTEPECKGCPLGTYSAALGATSIDTCELCDVGQYKDTTGGAACTTCPPGRYGDVKGLTQCKLCPSGKAMTTSGNIIIQQCITCSAGKYSVSDRSSCQDCDSGKVSFPGADQCLNQCPYGTYSLSAQMCSFCAAGQYQDSDGQTSCKYCASGKYEDEIGQTNCKSCTASSTGPPDCLQFSKDYSGGRSCIDDSGVSDGRTYAQCKLPASTWELACADDSGRSAEQCVIGASTWGYCADGTIIIKTTCNQTSTWYDVCVDRPGRTEAQCGLNASTWGYCADGSGRDATQCVLGAGKWSTPWTKAKTWPDGELSGPCQERREWDGFYLVNTSILGSTSCDYTTRVEIIPVSNTICAPSCYEHVLMYESPCPIGHYFHYIGDPDNQYPEAKCLKCPIGRYADEPWVHRWAHDYRSEFAYQSSRQIYNGRELINNRCRNDPTCSLYTLYPSVTDWPTTKWNGVTWDKRGVHEYARVHQSPCKECPLGFTNDITGAGDPEFCTRCPLGKRGVIHATNHTSFRVEYWAPDYTTIRTPACEICPEGKYTDELIETEASQWLEKCVDGSERNEEQCIMDASIFDKTVCADDTGRSEADCTKSVQRSNYLGDLGCTANPTQDACWPASTFDKTVCRDDSGRNQAQCVMGASTWGYCADGSGRDYVQCEMKIGTSECKSCESGRYQSQKGQTTCAGNKCSFGKMGSIGQASLNNCQSCTAGQYQDTEGADECKTCPSGFYSGDDAGVCTACPEGTFNSGEGASGCTLCSSAKSHELTGQVTDDACTTCPAGKQYKQYPTYTECEDCPVDGKRSIDGGQCVLTTCPTGTYAGDKLDCQQCPAGKYQDSTGQNICKNCGAGKYSSVIGANDESTCEDCPGVTYSKAGEVSINNCYDCPLGTIPNSAGQCDDCPAGKFQEGVQCSSCALGKAQAHVRSTSCTPCPNGRYADQTGLEICKPCRGTVSSDKTQCSETCGANSELITSTYICLDCPTGTELQDGDCVDCPSGKFNSVAGNTCQNCPADSYTDRTTRSSCITCPSGTYQLETKTDVLFEPFSNCVVCESGRYQSEEGQYDCDGDKCPRGKYGASNSSACYMCGPGRYQSEEGKYTCDYCPAKTYQDATGQYECKECPGEFLGSLNGSPTGQKDCGEKCPTGSFCSLKQLSTNLPWVQISPTVFELAADDIQAITSPTKAEYTLKIDGWTSTDGGQSSPEDKDIHCMWGSTFYEYTCKHIYNAWDGSFRSGPCDDCYSFFDRTGYVDDTLRAWARDKGFDIPRRQAMEQITTNPGILRHDLTDFKDEIIVSSQSNGRRDTPASFSVILFKVFDVISVAIKDTSITPDSVMQEMSSWKPVVVTITPVKKTPGYTVVKLPFNKEYESSEILDIEQIRTALQSKMSEFQITNVDNKILRFKVSKNETTVPHKYYNVELVTCAAGTYFNDTTCQSCPKGRFQPEAGQLECLECVGDYQDETGQLSCKTCGKGQESTSSTTRFCSTCPSGKYNSVGSGVCKLCPKGRWQSRENAEDGLQCELCPIGMYSDITGAKHPFSSAYAKTCKKCPASMSTNQAGSTSISDCTRPQNIGGAGISTWTYMSYDMLQIELEKFAPCALGQQGQLIDATSKVYGCVSCPIGKYGVTVNICDDCNPGRYQNEEGEIHCKLTGLGYWEPDTGEIKDEATETDSIYACPQGKYGDVTGMTSSADCKNCPLGMYNDEQGQAKCKFCDMGKQSDIMGSINPSDCIACPAGQFSNKAGSHGIEFISEEFELRQEDFEQLQMSEDYSRLFVSDDDMRNVYLQHKEVEFKLRPAAQWSNEDGLCTDGSGRSEKYCTKNITVGDIFECQNEYILKLPHDISSMWRSNKKYTLTFSGTSDVDTNTEEYFTDGSITDSVNTLKTVVTGLINTDLKFRASKVDVKFKFDVSKFVTDFDTSKPMAENTWPIDFNLTAKAFENITTNIAKFGYQRVLFNILLGNSPETWGIGNFSSYMNNDDGILELTSEDLTADLKDHRFTKTFDWETEMLHKRYRIAESVLLQTHKPDIFKPVLNFTIWNNSNVADYIAKKTDGQPWYNATLDTEERVWIFESTTNDEIDLPVFDVTVISNPRVEDLTPFPTDLLSLNILINEYSDDYKAIYSETFIELIAKELDTISLKDSTWKMAKNDEDEVMDGTFQRAEYILNDEKSFTWENFTYKICIGKNDDGTYSIPISTTEDVLTNFYLIVETWNKIQEKFGFDISQQTVDSQTQATCIETDSAVKLHTNRNTTVTEINSRSIVLPDGFAQFNASKVSDEQDTNILYIVKMHTDVVCELPADSPDILKCDDDLPNTDWLTKIQNASETYKTYELRVVGDTQIGVTLQNLNANSNTYEYYVYEHIHDVHIIHARALTSGPWVSTLVMDNANISAPVLEVENDGGATIHIDHTFITVDNGEHNIRIDHQYTTSLDILNWLKNQPNISKYYTIANITNSDNTSIILKSDQAGSLAPVIDCCLVDDEDKTHFPVETVCEQHLSEVQIFNRLYSKEVFDIELFAQQTTFLLGQDERQWTCKATDTIIMTCTSDIIGTDVEDLVLKDTTYITMNEINSGTSDSRITDNTDIDTVRGIIEEEINNIEWSFNNELWTLTVNEQPSNNTIQKFGLGKKLEGIQIGGVNIFAPNTLSVVTPTTIRSMIDKTLVEGTVITQDAYYALPKVIHPYKFELNTVQIEKSNKHCKNDNWCTPYPPLMKMEDKNMNICGVDRACFVIYCQSDATFINSTCTSVEPRECLYEMPTYHNLLYSEFEIDIQSCYHKFIVSGNDFVTKIKETFVAQHSLIITEDSFDRFKVKYDTIVANSHVDIFFKYSEKSEFTGQWQTKHVTISEYDVNAIASAYHKQVSYTIPYDTVKFERYQESARWIMGYCIIDGEIHHYETNGEEYCKAYEGTWTAPLCSDSSKTTQIECEDGGAIVNVKLKFNAKDDIEFSAPIHEIVNNIQTKIGEDYTVESTDGVSLDPPEIVITARQKGPQYAIEKFLVYGSGQSKNFLPEIKPMIDPRYTETKNYIVPESIDENTVNMDLQKIPFDGMTDFSDFIINGDDFVRILAPHERQFQQGMILKKGTENIPPKFDVNWDISDTLTTVRFEQTPMFKTFDPDITPKCEIAHTECVGAWQDYFTKKDDPNTDVSYWKSNTDAALYGDEIIPYDLKFQIQPNWDNFRTENTYQRNRCTKCPVGKYTDQIGQTECIDSPIEKYIKHVGSNVDGTNCPAGRWGARRGNDEELDCVDCFPGRYQPLDGKQWCALTSPGYHQYKEGQLIQVSCQPGFYQNEYGQGTCKECPAGFYQDESTKKRCKECPAGEYQNELAQPSCKDCPIAEYQNELAQTECKECPQDHYARRLAIPPPENNADDSKPKATNTGTIKFETGQKDCTHCELGFHQPLTKQLHCIIIPSDDENSPELHKACNKKCIGQRCNKCALSPEFVTRVKNEQLHDKFESFQSENNVLFTNTPSISKKKYNEGFGTKTGAWLLENSRYWSHFISTVNPFDDVDSSSHSPVNYEQQDLPTWNFVPDGVVESTSPGQLVDGRMMDLRSSPGKIYKQVCPYWIKPSSTASTAGHWYGFFDPGGKDNAIYTEEYKNKPDADIHRHGDDGSQFKENDENTIDIDYNGFASRPATQSSGGPRFTFRTSGDGLCQQCPAGYYASLSPLPGDDPATRKAHYEGEGPSKDGGPKTSWKYPGRPDCGVACAAELLVAGNDKAKQTEVGKKYVKNNCGAAKDHLDYGSTPCVACQPGFYLDTPGNYAYSRFPDRPATQSLTIEEHFDAILSMTESRPPRSSQGVNPFGFHNINGAGPEIAKKQEPSVGSFPGKLTQQLKPGGRPGGLCRENLLFAKTPPDTDEDDPWIIADNFANWGAQPVKMNTGESEDAYEGMEWHPPEVYQRFPSFEDPQQYEPMKIGACLACPIGKYSNIYGATECLPCPSGSTKHFGKDGQWMAQDGFAGCHTSMSIFPTIDFMNIINPPSGEIKFCTGDEEGFAKVTCKLAVNPINTIILHMLAQPLLVANIALAEIVPKHVGEVNNNQDSLYGKGIAERFCLLMYTAANESPFMANFLTSLMDFTPQGLALGQKYLSRVGTSADIIQKMYEVCDVPGFQESGGGLAKTAKKVFCKVRPQLNWVSSQDWWYGRGYDVIETRTIKLKDMFDNSDYWLHYSAIQEANPDGIADLGQNSCERCGIRVHPSDCDIPKTGTGCNYEGAAVNATKKPILTLIANKQAHYACENEDDCNENPICTLTKSNGCRAKGISYDSVGKYFSEVYYTDKKMGYELFRDIAMTDPSHGGDINAQGRPDKFDWEGCKSKECNNVKPGHLFSVQTSSEGNGWSKETDSLWYDTKAPVRYNFPRKFECIDSYCEPYKATDRLALAAARLNWNMDTKIEITRRRKVMKCGRDSVNAAEVGVKPDTKKAKKERNKSRAKAKFREKYVKSSTAKPFESLIKKKTAKAGADKMKVKLGGAALGNMARPAGTLTRGVSSQKEAEKKCSKYCKTKQLRRAFAPYNQTERKTGDVPGPSWLDCKKKCTETGALCSDGSGRDKINCVKAHSFTINLCLDSKYNNMASEASRYCIDPTATWAPDTEKCAKTVVCSLEPAEWEYMCPSTQDTKCYDQVIQDAANPNVNSQGEFAEQIALGIRNTAAEVWGKGSSYMYFKWWPNHKDARMAFHGQNKFFFDTAVHGSVGIRYSTSANFESGKGSLDKAFDNTDVTWGDELKEPPPFLYHQFSFGVNKNFKKMFKSELGCLKNVAKLLNGLIQVTKQSTNGESINKDHRNDIIRGALMSAVNCHAAGKPSAEKKGKQLRKEYNLPPKKTPAEKKKKKKTFRKIKDAFAGGEVEGSLTFGVTHPRCFSWLLDPRGSKYDETIETWVPSFEKFDTCTGEVYSAAFDEDE